MNKITDFITTLFVVIMTCVVSFVLSAAQRNDANLRDGNLLLFLFGFWGSVICIAIRYAFLYFAAIRQNGVLKKILMLLYLTVGSGIFIGVLVVVLELSVFSLEHDVLAHYNSYQIFMVVLLLSQWLGEKLFENKK